MTKFKLRFLPRLGHRRAAPGHGQAMDGPWTGYGPFLDKPQKQKCRYAPLQSEKTKLGGILSKQNLLALHANTRRKKLPLRGTCHQFVIALKKTN